MEKEFFKIFNKFTSFISMIGTTLTSLLGGEWILFAGYLILNITDYVTGTIKSKVNKEENSKKGLKGILKKICYWILIGISFLISQLLVKLGTQINVNLEFVWFFGWFTLTCLIINESRSIIENFIEIGIYVPEFLKKGLEVYENIVNNTIDNLSNKNSK